MHAIEGSILLTSNSVASADYLDVFCAPISLTDTLPQVTLFLKAKLFPDT